MAGKPIFKPGVLTMMGFGENLQVVVKRLNNTGARVSFYRHVKLSDEVRLSVPFLVSDVKARVVWQKRGSADLVFDAPAQS